MVLPATGGKDSGNENTVLILKYLQSHYAAISLTQLASFFNYSERQVQRMALDLLFHFAKDESTRERFCVLPCTM